MREHNFTTNNSKRKEGSDTAVIVYKCKRLQSFHIQVHRRRSVHSMPPHKVQIWLAQVF